jgi:hypothetical protein
MEFNGAIDWFHPSGSFTSRPSVSGVDGSVSGIALRQENYFTDAAHFVIVDSGLAFTELNKGGLSTSVFAVPVTRNVTLHPKFTIFTKKIDSEAPSEWVIRLYKNFVAVASGWFRWNPTDLTTEVTWGSWLTGGEPSNIKFETFSGSENTDTWGLFADNDGSGTLIDTIVIRAELGFSIMDNYPDS